MNGADKAQPRFDPEGPGYDEIIGRELIQMFPLTIPKPTVFQGEVLKSKNSFTAWVWEKDHYTLHGGSLDPRTGMVLKGRQHVNWDLMYEDELRRGNEIIQDPITGRYYSIPTTGGGW